MVQKILGFLFTTIVLLFIGGAWMLHILSDDKSHNPIFGYQPLIVLSNSMMPEFKASDMIIIKEKEIIQEGDVITFRADQNLVTHRVIDAQGEYFETQGDNNVYPDSELVHMSSILGVHQFTIPSFGKISSFIASPLGIIVFVITPLVLVAVIEIFRRLFPSTDKSN
ncbi:signal peptidase I [Alkalihalobacterium chitinilyticum]|uniref:Signal peptidase I n=1 Tax=Alkalihalobacterium chitinilyticum TaxID=2980103 RepID=A0ABT5VGN0_9BACI|nr:signal peptidase I [Alkalihalobacterium chitinilyticum]MDE5414610.1 signal peptidase I [Alkalihalobacterium chitinilyticum]